MVQTILFNSVLLVLCATQNLAEIQANCRDNVSLPCPAVTGDDMDFSSLAWYQISSSGRRGIIRKKKANNTLLRYHFNRPADLGARFSLLLPNVMPTDSATYECNIQAKVGGKNRDGKVNLKVHECVTSTETITSTWHTTPSSPVTIKDLPVVWTSTGYVLLAMAKILLSFILVWVNPLHPIVYEAAVSNETKKSTLLTDDS